MVGRSLYTVLAEKNLLDRELATIAVLQARYRVAQTLW